MTAQLDLGGPPTQLKAMSFDPNSPITHRSVLTVAVPIMLSNVSEPLIGVVNTAVIGQLPDPYYIGAIAVGALIFSFIFWGFGFLRLSTGGLSAQAMGAGDTPELVAVLARSLMIGLVAGIGLIAAVAADPRGGLRPHRRFGGDPRTWRDLFQLPHLGGAGGAGELLRHGLVHRPVAGQAGLHGAAVSERHQHGAVGASSCWSSA